MYINWYVWIIMANKSIRLKWEEKSWISMNFWIQIEQHWLYQNKFYLRFKFPKVCGLLPVRRPAKRCCQRCSELKLLFLLRDSYGYFTLKRAAECRFHSYCNWATVLTFCIIFYRDFLLLLTPGPFYLPKPFLSISSDAGQQSIKFLRQFILRSPFCGTKRHMT